MKKVFLFIFTISFCAVFASCGSDTPSFPINHIVIYKGDGSQLPNPAILTKGIPFPFKAVFYNAKNEVMTVAHPENIVWTAGPTIDPSWVSPSNTGTSYTMTLTIPTTYTTPSTSFIKVEYATVPETIPATSENIQIID